MWCSWYRYFEEVTAADVLENLAAFDDHDLAVDVVQIDDGWSPGLGEGLRRVRGSGRCAALVDAIRDTGRRAGHLAGAVPASAPDDPRRASTPSGWSAPPVATGARTWSGWT